MIVARTTTDAIGRLVTAAQNLGQDELETRVGDVHAGPELQLLAAPSTRPPSGSPAPSRPSAGSTPSGAT